jgi:hypothetical protein
LSEIIVLIDWLVGKRQHSRIIVLITGVALIIGAGITVVASGVNPGRGGRDRKAVEHTLVDDLRSVSRTSKAADRKQAIQLQHDYDAIFAKVLERNPGMQPVWKSVPDEKNAFLQWLNFCDQHRSKRNGGIGTWHGAKLHLPDDVQQILNGKKDWDAATISAYLKHNSDLMSELVRIGLMPDQSAKGISVDRWGFMSLNIVKQSGELLCADARLAAETGDSMRALERIQAAMGLARLLTQIEAPSLTTETGSILVKLTVLEKSMKHVIPALKLTEAEATEWRVALGHTREPDISNTVRGEFHATLRGLAIPIIVTRPEEISDTRIPDTDALYDSLAQHHLGLIETAQMATHKDLWLKQAGFDLLPQNHENLSAEAQKAVGMLALGWSIYMKGWTRAAAINRQYDAAMALLEGSDPPVELITGKPFVFDPVTRSLAFPSDPDLKGIKADPIKLP